MRVPSAPDAEMVLPLAEERLVVGAREVETGRVRVRTVTDAIEAQARAELTRTDIVVEHVPAGRWLDVMPPIREEDGVTIVPVVEERLVIEKRLFLIEEIRLVPRLSTRSHEEPVTLRRQRAVVERLPPENPEGVK